MTFGDPTVFAPAARILLVLTNDPLVTAVAERDTKGWVLTYRPDATAEQIQAALDSIGAPYTVTKVYPLMWEPKPAARRPGPPPRAETSRERNERWRREGR